MNLTKIFDTVNNLKAGQIIQINDWASPMLVSGVSKNFVVAHDAKDEYTIISKTPAPEGYHYNGVTEGQCYCGPDFWSLGYWDGYHFDDPEWNNNYLESLETSETEISQRNRASIYLIKVLDD